MAATCYIYIKADRDLDSYITKLTPEVFGYPFIRKIDWLTDHPSHLPAWGCTALHACLPIADAQEAAGHPKEAAGYKGALFTRCYSWCERVMCNKSCYIRLESSSFMLLSWSACTRWLMWISSMACSAWQTKKTWREHYIMWGEDRGSRTKGRGCWKRQRQRLLATAGVATAGERVSAATREAAETRWMDLVSKHDSW